MARATSPGSVVPPPRFVTRLSAPVAFPAQTAAVLRITAAGHLPAGAQAGGEALEPRFEVFSGSLELVWPFALHVVPCTVHVGRR